MSPGSTLDHLLLLQTPPALSTRTKYLQKCKNFLSVQINVYIYKCMNFLSVRDSAFFSISSPLRPAAAVFHLTRFPDDSVFCSSHQPLFLSILSPACASFQVEKAPSALPALHCTVTSCFPLKQTQSQNSKHSLQGVPYFILPPFFITRTKAKSRNVSAVGGGKRAEPTDTCRICISHLIYSLTSCVSAVCRGHAEVAPACTSGCLDWSRSTTSVMMTVKMMMETTGMTKMKGDLVRHSLTYSTPACDYSFFPAMSILPAAFADIWKHFPLVFLAALQ